MKQLAVLFVMVAGYLQAIAQNVGIGTLTPAASAKLDVVSTTKGVLVPRVTTAQMNAIASPANGLLVYNTTASAFAYRTASGWVFLTGGANAGAGWSTLGNAGANPANNFIGTVDSRPVVVRQSNVRAGLLDSANTSWGQGALNPNSSGTDNTAMGMGTLAYNTTGSYNTANGSGAMQANTTGNSNTAHGYGALLFNTEGSNNTVVGRGAAIYNRTGNGNTADGVNALLFNTSGNSNVAVGISALFNNTNRSNLVAIGDSALYNNGLDTTEDLYATRNTAVGSKSLFANTAGFFNTATGADALRSNTGGFKNTANGVDALFGNTTGNLNTAIGTDALRSNETGEGNTANGVAALRSNTTGNNNTANGLSALLSNTKGIRNTAIGASSLSANTSGSNNTANGASALASNITGSGNTALGRSALFSNTTISNLVAIGDSALYNNGEGATGNTQATANTALGSKALYTNNTGYDNTANGYQALYSNTIGDANTAIGREALFTNQAGYSNTAMGNKALYSNAAGFANTALGYQAGYNNQSGGGNVFIGHNAGFNETGNNKLYINNDGFPALIYGEFNTDKLQVNNKLGIGRLPAAYPLEIQALGAGNELLKLFNTAGTERWHINLLPAGGLNFVETNVADYRLVLGTGGEVGIGKIPFNSQNDSRLIVKQKGSQNGLGIEAAATSNHWDFYVGANASADLQLYYNGVFKGAYGNAGGVYTPSDKRLKKDIATYEPVLNKIQQLEAFHYHYLDNKGTDPLSTGFMAKDVQKLFPDAVSEMDMKNGEKMLGINYQYFTVVAIKGLQEQQAKIETLEERIAKLEGLVKTITEKK